MRKTGAPRWSGRPEDTGTILASVRYPDMSLLITALILLIVLALVVWLVDRSPFDRTIKWCIIALAVVGAIVWLLSRIGVAT